jgi:hypothetical protein
MDGRLEPTIKPLRLLTQWISPCNSTSLNLLKYIGYWPTWLRGLDLGESTTRSSFWWRASNRGPSHGISTPAAVASPRELPRHRSVVRPKVSPARRTAGVSPQTISVLRSAPSRLHAPARQGVPDALAATAQAIYGTVGVGAATGPPYACFRMALRPPGSGGLWHHECAVPRGLAIARSLRPAPGVASR